MKVVVRVVAAAAVAVAVAGMTGSPAAASRRQPAHPRGEARPRPRPGHQASQVHPAPHVDPPRRKGHEIDAAPTVRALSTGRSDEARGAAKQPRLAPMDAAAAAAAATATAAAATAAAAAAHPRGSVGVGDGCVAGAVEKGRRVKGAARDGEGADVGRAARMGSGPGKAGGRLRSRAAGIIRAGPGGADDDEPRGRARVDRGRHRRSRRSPKEVVRRVRPPRWRTRRRNCCRRRRAHVPAGAPRPRRGHRRRGNSRRVRLGVRHGLSVELGSVSLGAGAGAGAGDARRQHTRVPAVFPSSLPPGGGKVARAGSSAPGGGVAMSHGPCVRRVDRPVGSGGRSSGGGGVGVGCTDDC